MMTTTPRNPATTIPTRASTVGAVVALILVVTTCAGGGGAVASPCPTDSEARYFQTLDEIMIRVGDSVNKFNSFIVELSQDLSVVHDNAWRFEVVTALAEYSLLADEIRAINPPELVRQIHHDHLVMAHEMEGFAVMFVSWLDTYHLDTLREASESQERVANLITKTTDRIEGFCR